MKRPRALLLLLAVGTAASGLDTPLRAQAPVLPFYQSVTWSPDGGKLAYTLQAGSWDDPQQVVIVCADGSGARTIAEGRFPAWSPDGRVAYAAPTPEGETLFLANPDGTDGHPIPHIPVPATHPTWSPDGSRIAFMGREHETWQILVADLPAGTVTRITDGATDAFHPAWSPAGDLIAFEADRDGNHRDEIYLVEAAPRRIMMPSWPGAFEQWGDTRRSTGEREH